MTETMQKPKRLTVELWNDPDSENPLDYMDWKYIPFSDRFVDNENIRDYLKKINEYGEAIPANIGIRSRLNAGTAFWVSMYEHSGRTWFLKGTHQTESWDTSSYAGILIATNPKRLPKTFAERQKDAINTIEFYEKWAEGHVYGFTIENEDDETYSESCGGFYNEDHMFKEIAELTKGNQVRFAGEAAWLADYTDEKFQDWEE